MREVHDTHGRCERRDGFDHYERFSKSICMTAISKILYERTLLQKLDPKMLQRLETAVSKSEYSQGKRLKVIPKVKRARIICFFAEANTSQGQS